MGGIIIRETMYQMQTNAGKDPFPSTIGYVTGVITFNTPHGGLDYTIPADSLQACGGCTQTSELMTGSSLMTELNKYGRYPEILLVGNTHWTVIGSECDQVTEGPGGPKKGYASAIDMDADFTVVYERNGTNTCYDYSGALHDSSITDNAWIYYCSSGLYPCGANYTLDTTGYISFAWINAGYGHHSLSQLYHLVSDAPMVPITPVNPPAPDNPLSIVFVHGIKIGPEMPGPIPYMPWKGSSSGWDCMKDYWGDAINFLSERGLTDFRTIKYYTGDTNCANGLETRYSSDLHNETYTKNCTDYHADAGPDGTNDESLYHLSCLFAQYLYHNFGQSNRDVIIVAHSMGGVITRGALYQMDIHAGQAPFPDTIGQVTKAITFNSPHGGVYGIDALGCAGCQQAQDLVYNSPFMSDLSSPAGLDPQPTKGLTTVWSAIGSECDNVVGGLLNPNQYANAIDMNANFALVYASGSDTCYDHGGAIHDNNIKLDAKYYYCNISETDGSPCGIDYNAKNPEWKETAKGLRGLQLMYYLISGLDIEQAGEGSRNNKALLIGLTVGGVATVAVGAGIIAKIVKEGNGCGGHGDGGPQASTSGPAHIEVVPQLGPQEITDGGHGGQGDGNRGRDGGKPVAHDDSVTDDGHQKPTDTTTENPVVKLEKEIMHEALEHGQFFTKDGDLIGDMIVGTASYIGLSSYRDIAKDAIFTHNHPQNGQLSMEDLETATDFDMLEIRAITADGQTFSMARGAEGWKVSDIKEIEKIQEDAKEELSHDPVASEILSGRQ